MLFILILLMAILVSFFFYKKTRRAIFILLTILLLILLVSECAVYTYFIYQCYLGKGIFLIGNQTLLDALYRFRLTYAVYYCQYKKSFYYRLDDELGYTIGSNKDTGIYASNSAGLRGKKEYSLIPEEGVLRIACFGDSFVHCDGEKDEDTWEHYLEKSVGNLEVLNFGVGGYGLTQSYLRYLKDGLRFSPGIVFSNYAIWGPRDDIHDFLAVAGGDDDLKQSHLYRVRSRIEQDILIHEASSINDLFDPEWRSENIYSKLDFYKRNRLLSNKVLSISNIGLLLKVCYMKYRIRGLSVGGRNEMSDVDSELIEAYNLKLLENYRDVAKINNSVLVFVINGDVRSKFPDFFEKNSKYVRYCDISGYCKRESDRLNPARENILNRTNHYNALGNKIYAAAVLDILKENKWPAGDKIFYYDAESNSFLYSNKSDKY